MGSNAASEVRWFFLLLYDTVGAGVVDTKELGEVITTKKKERKKSN